MARNVMAVAFAIALVVASASVSAAQGSRVALVIGNSAYNPSPALKNPANDAEDVARVLEGIGFDVTLARDKGRAALNETLNAFYAKAAGAGAALLY